VSIKRSFLFISEAFLFVLSAFGRDSEQGMRAEGFPKRLHWQGKVKGETVTMDIEAGAFVAAEHKVKDSGGTIDGYRSLPGYMTSWGNGFPHLIITDWRIRWGGKPVHIPRGVYTSVFTPQLTGPKSYFDMDSSEVCVMSSDRGSALVVSMGCGYDGVTLTLAFVITKDGRVHRFVLGGSS
jgi:hypothetical protein